ncbi:MAG: aminoacetone oxidase family FAD-binding enzyme [Clostridiales bacterium]|nr:aminoacetone oxidase family FAD-binding enzyme [Clostridiales bacterium]
MKQCDLIVVGGGASGLAAAIEAGRRGLTVTLLERLPRVGKKILVTGNGRCNISNTAFKDHNYRNAGFARDVLEKFDLRSTVDFFESIGLMLTDDGEGRLYPMSNTAAGVLDLLRLECELLGVNTVCDCKVTDIRQSDGGFTVNGEYRSKAVIVAAGGCASPVHGSDGSGFELLKKLGHRITPVVPSLVQLIADESVTKQLKGLRCSAKISLKAGNRTLASSRGEILFTDYGISGIAAMEVSGKAAELFYGELEASCTAVLDLAPELSGDDIRRFIANRVKFSPESELEMLLVGILPKGIARCVCKKACGLPLNSRISDLKNEDIKTISERVKNFELPLKGTKGFSQAQVSRGGADVGQFDRNTLESLIVKNLYACGEVLDVDGGCGGFNLQWAWSSGRACACAAAEKIKNKD